MPIHVSVVSILMFIKLEQCEVPICVSSYNKSEICTLSGNVRNYYLVSFSVSYLCKYRFNFHMLQMQM